MLRNILPFVLISRQVFADLIIYANPTEFRPDVSTILEVGADNGLELISATWSFDDPHIIIEEGQDAHKPHISVRLVDYVGPSKLAVIRVTAKAVDGTEISTLAGMNIVGSLATSSTTSTTTTSSTTTPRASTTTTTTLATTAPSTSVTKTVRPNLSIRSPSDLRFERPAEFIASTWFAPCEYQRSWSWECTSPKGGLLDTALSQPSEVKIIFYLKKSNKCERAIVRHSCRGSTGFEVAQSPELLVEHE